MCVSFVLNNNLRAEGKSFFSMIALASGGVLNIILDPIFIFVLKMGISGAALATVISQIISCGFLLSWFLVGKTICKINIKYFFQNFSLLGKIIPTGIPSFARQGMGSIASILLNTMAGRFGGDSAVAAMSIVTKILMFIGSIMIGIGQGYSPVSGYNYGAKRYDRVKKAFFFMVSSSFVLLSIISIVCCVFAPQIMKAFRDDADVIKIGTVALRWQAAFMPFHSIIVGVNMMMQSTKHIKQAMFLSMNRQGIFFIPAILILSFSFGLFGVEISQFVADVLSTITAVPFLIWFFKKLEKLEKESLC